MRTCPRMPESGHATPRDSVYYIGMRITPLPMTCLLAVLVLCSCSESDPPYAEQLDLAAAPPGRQPAREGMVYAAWLPQGVTIVLEDRSGRASPEEPVFIACDANEWRPDDPAWRMTRGADGRWTFDLEQRTSENEPDGLRFKFTRGSWDRVECHSDGADVSDRSLPVVLRIRVEDGRRPRLEHVVDAWADGFESRPEGQQRSAPRP